MHQMPEAGAIIDPDLLALLVCPIDHAVLELRESTLVCTKCARVYPVVDGIPNMVVDE
jgi:uncharacterized protein YbaR (Trm112 family)